MGFGSNREIVHSFIYTGSLFRVLKSYIRKAGESVHVCMNAPTVEMGAYQSDF